MPATVVVVGMHRSGTSVLGAILQGMGIDMGEDAFGPTPFNPTGHFEDRLALALNQKILKHAGGSWHHPPSRQRVAEAGDALAHEIEGVYRPTGEGMRGFKDPRICLTLGAIRPHLVDPIFVVCRREPEAIAESLRVRNGIPLDRGLALCRHYEAEIRAFFADHPAERPIEVGYRDLLDRPAAVIRALAEGLGIDLPDERVRELSSLVIPRSALPGAKWRHMWKVGTREPWKIPEFLYRRARVSLRRLLRK